MRLGEANRLLDAFCLPFESGWIRLENGVVHVAARTPMIGCTPAMVEWWFGFIHTTEQYRWWHPRDHLFSDWDGERGTGRYLGGTHLVHEYIGGDIYKLKINFRDPAEILDAGRFSEARVGTAIFGYVGDLERPGYFGRVLHLVQTTAEGGGGGRRGGGGGGGSPGPPPGRRAAPGAPASGSASSTPCPTRSRRSRRCGNWYPTLSERGCMPIPRKRWAFSRQIFRPCTGSTTAVAARNTERLHDADERSGMKNGGKPTSRQEHNHARGERDAPTDFGTRDIDARLPAHGGRSA